MKKTIEEFIKVNWNKSKTHNKKSKQSKAKEKETLKINEFKDEDEWGGYEKVNEIKDGK